MKKIIFITTILLLAACSQKSKVIQDWRENRAQSQVDFYTFIAEHNYARQATKHPKFTNKIQVKEYHNRWNDSIATSFKQHMNDYIDTWGWEIHNWTGVIDEISSYGGDRGGLVSGEEKIYIKIKGWLSYPNDVQGPSNAKNKFKIYTQFYNTSSAMAEAEVMYRLVDQYYVDPQSGYRELQNKGAYIPNSYNWDRDKTWGLIIEKDSEVYNQVYNLAEGDKIYFSGKFLPNYRIRDKQEYFNDIYEYPMNCNKPSPILDKVGLKRFEKWKFHISITDVKKRSEFIAKKNEDGELELINK